MIELDSLVIKGMRRFDTEQTIDFTKIGKISQIDGINNNTGGSSGAGKSTIAIALSWLLDVSSVPSTVLKTRHTKMPMEVTGNFKFEDIPVNITRSSKTGYTVVTPDETISGNADLAKEKIEELIGIPKKIFKKMIHKEQGEVGFFLSMTPKEIYEFLVKMLGLEKYIIQADRIAVNVKATGNKVDGYRTNVEMDKGSILNLEQVLKDKIKPTCTISLEEVGNLQNKLSLIEQKIEKIQKDKCETLRETEKKYPEPKMSEYDLTELKVLETKQKYGVDKITEISEAGKKIQSQIDGISILRSKTIELGSQIKQLTVNKSDIEKAVCHTCKQTWTGDTAKQEIEKIKADIDKKTTEALSLKSEIDNEDKYKEDINRINRILDEINARNEMCRLAIQTERDKYITHTSSFEAIKIRAEKEFGEKYLEVERGFEVIIAKLQDEAYKIHTEFTKKDTEFKGYKTRAKEYETEIENITETISNKKAEMSAREKSILDLEKKISIAEEAKRLVKTYVLQTFQETLDLIGEMATEIIGSIPNMSNSTIYFEGCKETKTGTIKDEVNAIINMDGINNIPIKSLCGGESASINLAVDFAAIDIIEARANKGANFMIIDEPFNGLDSICKEECLQVLNQIDTNKKIIMIDHSSELKEMVSDVITVIRTGESSVIQQ